MSQQKHNLLPKDWSQHVRKAWATLRKHDSSIPDELLDIMRDMLLAAEMPISQEKEQPNTMRTYTYEAEAQKLDDGAVAVWTDGVSLQADNDMCCVFPLKAGNWYRVTVSATLPTGTASSPSKPNSPVRD